MGWGKRDNPPKIKKPKKNRGLPGPCWPCLIGRCWACTGGRCTCPRPHS